MKTKSINAIIDVVIRPNACFVNISESAKYYFVSAVIIFAIAGCSPLLSEIMKTSNWSNSDDNDGQNYLGFKTITLPLSVFNTVLQNFVFIVAVFWIGKKLYGGTNFKKIFLVLSYCLIPTIIAALVIPVEMQLASQSLFTEVGEAELILILNYRQAMQ